MKKMMFRCVIVAAVACGVATPASAGQLQLSMKDGRVTLIADNVPLRQILQEWARVGQTKIVNGDNISGPALTLQLINATERDVLDVLLRSASGYIAAPRHVAVAGAAVYDRITILATSRAPNVSASAAPTPTFQRPPPPVEDNDEPINVAMPPPPPSPVTSQFPGMPPGMQPPATSAQPGPITSPRPGAVPQPVVPNGAPNPYQPYPPPVVKPGGGGPGELRL
jgi:hypothetical protein